jgi:hypothetical protein
MPAATSAYPKIANLTIDLEAEPLAKIKNDKRQSRLPKETSEQKLIPQHESVKTKKT